MTTLRIEEDKQFLLAQRQPGRVGCLGAVDKISAIAEEKREKRKRDENTRLEQHIASKIAKNSIDALPQMFSEESEDEEEAECAQIVTVSQGVSGGRRARKHFMTPKLVAVLDRCQVSVRYAVFILQATAEALGHSLDELIITATSIHKVRSQLRTQRAAELKSNILKSLTQFVVVHWDGKLLPALSIHEQKVERLPIVVSGLGSEMLIDVPRLDSSSGEEQAAAVHKALQDWQLCDRVQALCCDTTSSNTGKKNGACVLLEKKLAKDLLYLPCRHHIYELVLKAVFESKLPMRSSSPDVPLFKDFKKSWPQLKSKKIVNGMKDSNCHGKLINFMENISQFVSQELKERQVREYYRELLQLALLFLKAESESDFKIRPPGAMHHARWMSKAIYCLKIFLLREDYPLPKEELNALGDVCCFIVRFYIKAWYKCSNAATACQTDIDLICQMVKYQDIDQMTARPALKKLMSHSWYLHHEISALAFFDETLELDTKKKMVQALTRVSVEQVDKRLPLHIEDIRNWEDKTVDEFINEKSAEMFRRFKIDDSFLSCDPENWSSHEAYIDGEKIVKSLRVVNDTAERAVKLMEDYHGLLTKDENKKNTFCSVFRSTEKFIQIVRKLF